LSVKELHHKVGRAMDETVSCQPPSWRSGFNPGHIMGDMWWIKCYWDRFLSKYFCFTLSASFHQCSIVNHQLLSVVHSLSMSHHFDIKHLFLCLSRHSVFAGLVDCTLVPALQCQKEFKIGGWSVCGPG